MLEEDQKAKTLFSFMNDIDRRNLEYKDLQIERQKALSLQQYEESCSREGSQDGSEDWSEAGEDETPVSAQLMREAQQKLLTANIFTENLLSKAVNHIRSISNQLKNFPYLNNESFELEIILKSVKDSYQKRQLQQSLAVVVPNAGLSYQGQNENRSTSQPTPFRRTLDQGTAQLIFEVRNFKSRQAKNLGGFAPFCRATLWPKRCRTTSFRSLEPQDNFII